MRRRSGALHCETEQQLLELASNHEMGLFYNEGPAFREVKFQNEWNMTSAQNQMSQTYDNFDFNEHQSEAKDQEKQLNRATRYLQNCVVDKEAIRCSIQICIITPKIQQVLTKMVSKDSLLDLFIHTKETGQNCIYKHSTISSSPNSNVFSLETTNVECAKIHSDKENHRMTPKNWLKSSKNEKMMELLIVKKHIRISQNTQIGPKQITIIHRIFIVNQKYLQNPLIKIYLQKSHYVLDARSETFKPHSNTDNKSKQQQLSNRPRKTSLYNKLFNNKSLFEKDCTIFNKGEFGSTITSQGEVSQFKFAFHKLQQRIAKTYMRKLNDMLIEEKRISSNSSKPRQK